MRAWADLDPVELRMLFTTVFEGHGQATEEAKSTLHLPVAGPSCQLTIRYRTGRIRSIERGPAFSPETWDRLCAEVSQTLLTGSRKFGRDYAFSSFRVTGSWQGSRSGVQILPPPEHAPRAPVEMAEHPFILEFPIVESIRWDVTNHRRRAEYRKLTAVLNLLLAGRTSAQPRQAEHLWASVPQGNGEFSIQWVQPFFFAKLGEVVVKQLSEVANLRIESIKPESYYGVVGHDGRALSVPDDLDDLLFRYQQLVPSDRSKFDRATFWMDMASRQWHIATSLSFAALVIAVESLTERGSRHRVHCPECNEIVEHDAPGATERFREFFEHYAPGTALRKRRSAMYRLRSGVLHGSELLQMDQDRAFGPDPIGWNEYELHSELWGLARHALRRWLQEAGQHSPPTSSHIAA